MTPRRLIVFSTPAEAAATLQRFHAQRDQADCDLYHSDIGTILVPGMGILAVAQAVCRYAPLADEVWNLGAAGTLCDNFKLGQLVQIATVKRNPLVPDYIDERAQLFQRHIYPQLILQAEGSHLVSSDYPIHNGTARKNLALSSSDLIDMEGYGIACAARYCDLKCLIWKVVTDWAQPGGPELIQQRLTTASEIIAEHLAWT